MWNKESGWRVLEGVCMEGKGSNEEMEVCVSMEMRRGRRKMRKRMVKGVQVMNCVLVTLLVWLTKGDLRNK